LIAAVSVRRLLPGSVLRVHLKEPWSATPSTGSSLVLKRPRTHRNLYRSEFYAVVESNIASARTLELQVADYRGVGIPGQSLKLWHFGVGYDFIKSAQLFTSLQPLPADVMLTALVADRLSKGSAPKLNVMPHFACAPLDLT
jgi:hypothetical protein